ncbi:MAG: hypothetical protein ASARMPRED_005951 [Alectoria sarmentosa]|nr:MAG: hypothetical protein ASARMPRED_005951 [Alectoria sarmentosa]
MQIPRISEGQGVSRQITPGTQTELTLRLEISRRQFFQWHFVEKRRIPEVKQKMDELTRALTLAGYDYDFIAAETQWRSRSCHWNTLRKLAWKVEPHQKGEGLPVPVELANVPIWLEGDQDVGDWRKSRSNETHRSHVSAAQADEHREPHRNKSHGNGYIQDVAVSEQVSDEWSCSPASEPRPPPPALVCKLLFSGTNDAVPGSAVKALGSKPLEWSQNGFGIIAGLAWGMSGMENRIEIVVACRGVRALGDEDMGVPVTKLGIFNQLASSGGAEDGGRWFLIFSP